MMKDNYKKLEKASQSYILNTEENLTINLIEYIKNRIIANKQEIESLVEKTQLSFSQILDIIENEIEEINHYKDYTNIVISKERFLSTSLKMPVGVIAVEAYDTLEVIKYYIKALKSKNAIAISDIEYDQYNLKCLILLIIKEALKKFEIDEDLIMLWPYDECFYQYFDEVIYTHNENGESLIEPKIEKKTKEEELYVYLENEELQEEAEKNEDAEILKGNIDKVLEIINSSGAKGAVIYTKDSSLAYKFINLAKCENVFVNTNLANIRDTKKSKDILYEYRNIIIPFPQDVLEEEKEEKVELQIKSMQEKQLSNDRQSIEKKELIIVEDENIFIKLKKWLKKIFHKYL